MQFLVEMASKRAHVVTRLHLNNLCNTIKCEQLNSLITHLYELHSLQLTNFPKNIQQQHNTNNQNSHYLLQNIPDILRRFTQLQTIQSSQFIISNLVSLKLSYCQLEDEDLEIMRIWEFNNLRSVNLSNNYLHGTTLFRIMELQKVRSRKMAKINLSNNPFTCLNAKSANEMDV